MGIVIITIPGEDKRTFANSLHKATGGKVDLVIIQKPKPNHNSFIERLKRLYRSVGLRKLFSEIFFAILLRSDDEAKETLGYFRERSPKISESEYLPKILETTTINSPEVEKIVKELAPDLLVIWGSVIVKPDILNTAKRAINLHMGLCPYYRGAIANQRAVMCHDIKHIGATIHYAAEKVDAGDIISTITVDTYKRPKELFRELNDRAEERYLEVATKLFQGEDLPHTPQSALEGDKFLLKDWTPSVRYKLSQKMLKWEMAGTLD